MTQLTHLPERGVIAVEGDDRVAFLQGLVSNDMQAVAPGHAVWTGLLTAQGKWLADFFVLSDDKRLLLDVEASQIHELVARLSRYRLRLDVTLRVAPEVSVYVAWPALPENLPSVSPPVLAPDPRLPNFAWRIVSRDPLPSNASPADWDRYRLSAGLPDGSKDMETGKTVLLEAGFDELNGVSWSKGCYMGQELTARTRYRGLVKRRLVPVRVEGPCPPPGTAILHDGKDVGSMRSGHDGIGLASLRLDALDGPLNCGEATLHPQVPTWMRLPQAS